MWILRWINGMLHHLIGGRTHTSTVNIKQFSQKTSATHLQVFSTADEVNLAIFRVTRLRVLIFKKTGYVYVRRADFKQSLGLV